MRLIAVGEDTREFGEAHVFAEFATNRLPGRVVGLPAQDSDDPVAVIDDASGYAGERIALAAELCSKGSSYLPSHLTS